MAKNMATKHHSKRSTNETIYSGLGCVAYGALIIGCMVAFCVNDFSDFKVLLLLFAAAVLPLFGGRVAKLAIGNLIEIRGSVSDIKCDVDDVKKATYSLVNKISARTGDINLNFGTSLSEQSEKNLIDQIQYIFAAEPESVRKKIEPLCDDARIKLAKRDQGYRGAVIKLLREVRGCPDIVKKHPELNEIARKLLNDKSE